jgi:hypothetical protein
MSIESMIIRNTPQTAVYWEVAGNDGEGGFTFADPIELTPPNGVRWEETIQVTSDNKGNEITSRAVIYLNQDVVEESMIYLGTLNDLDSADEENPKLVEGAWIIKRFVKTPDLKGQGYLRKAYLTPSLSFGGF